LDELRNADADSEKTTPASRTRFERLKPSSRAKTL
jgi:hypothetical protein